MMKKNGMQSIFWIFVIFITFLSSCDFLAHHDQPIVIRGDGGVLTNIPCGPPCLMGITPGVTTLEEVESILTNQYMLENCIYFDNAIEGGSAGYQCGNNLIISVTGNSARVNSIGFIPQVKIGLDDVIDKYGAPSCVQIIPDGLPEEEFSVALVYFDTIQTRLTLIIQPGAEYNLSEETEVESVSYFEQSQYQALLISDYSQEWTGYHNYYVVER